MKNEERYPKNKRSCFWSRFFKKASREFNSPHPHHNEPTTSYTDFAVWLKRKHNIADITIVGKLKKLKKQ